MLFIKYIQRFVRLLDNKKNTSDCTSQPGKFNPKQCFLEKPLFVYFLIKTSGKPVYVGPCSVRELDRLVILKTSEPVLFNQKL